MSCPQSTRLRLAIGLALSLCGSLSLGASAARADQDRPLNVLFVVADDLGWSDTTLYGTTRLYETPNIERLARRGVRFTNAYSAGPMCTPTRSALMSGLYPARTGLTEAAGHIPQERLAVERKEQGPAWMRAATPWGASRLKLEYRTLAEAVKEEGYDTGHFGKWHLGREPFDPLHQGFDTDVPHTYGPTQPGRFLGPWEWPEGVTYDRGRPGEFIDDRIADEAIKFMSAHRNRAFFCNVWTFAAHGGPQTTSALIEKYAKKIESLGPSYPQRNPETAGLIEQLDGAVGRIVDAVDSLGMADRTVIIFTSDNGGWSWPSGQRKDVAMTSNAPLRSGKSSLYEGGTRVPLVVVWPGKTLPGSRSDAMINSVDLYPTVLDVLHLMRPPGVSLDGVSQVAALLGAGTPREVAFCFFPHYDRDRAGPGAWVRRGDWKLIVRFFDRVDQTDGFELYNLREDLGETKNLADHHPKRVRELDALLRDHLKNTNAVIPVKNPNYRPGAIPPVSS